MVRLQHTFSHELVPKAPFSFELTVRKPAGWDLFTPFEVCQEGVLWTALHIEGRLVGVRLESLGTTDTPRISVTMFTEANPSSAQEQAIKDTIASKLGAFDDLTEFYGLARTDEILRHTVADLYGMHDTDYSGTFPATILAICLQMAPVKRSDEMMRSLALRYGEAAEFDGKEVRVWPTPSAISRLNPRELEKSCRVGYRAKYLVGAAKVLSGGDFPTIEELERLGAEEAKKKLLELPGIGDYSADIINPGHGFPIDAWSVDVFGKLFFGNEPENAREAIERVKQEGIRRWGEWSWMAFFYVAQDLRNLSKKLGVELRLS